MLTTRRRTPIGLDIGDSAMRAVQLRRSAERYTLSAAAQFDRAASPDPDAAGRLASGLGTLLRESSFGGRVVVTALNPPQVEFHVLDLPAAVLRAPDDEAGRMVHFEVGRLTNEPLNQVEIRHWRLPEAFGSAPNAIGVSAGREAVTDLVSACQRAGLVCSCVDTGATALCRFGRLLKAWPEDAVWGVLDIGAVQARLVLCLAGEAGSPVLVRPSGAGGREWTQRIAETLQLSSGSAEVQKQAHGIALLGRGTEGRRVEGGATLESAQYADTSRGDTGETTGSRQGRSEIASLLLGALRSDLQELAAEVKRSYEYVLSCYPPRRAGDLVLVGGGALLRNLPEYLAAALGITVRPASSYLGEPTCRLDYGTDGRHPLELFATAVGLAVDR